MTEEKLYDIKLLENDNIIFKSDIMENDILKLIHTIKVPMFYRPEGYLEIINDPYNFDKFYYVRFNDSFISKFYMGVDNEWYGISDKGDTFRIVLK